MSFQRVLKHFRQHDIRAINCEAGDAPNWETFDPINPAAAFQVRSIMDISYQIGTICV